MQAEMAYAWRDIFKETARVMQLNKFQWIQAKCFTV